MVASNRHSSGFDALRSLRSRRFGINRFEILHPTGLEVEEVAVVFGGEAVFAVDQVRAAVRGRGLLRCPRVIEC